jgi:hypothetical protein
MSPNPPNITDELRDALSSRTEPVGLSPDFLAGVERKARRLRGQRAAAAVAGSALAVSALGVGGPMLATTLARDPAPPMATSAPTVVEQSSRWALDPSDPWPYRGDPAVTADGNQDAYARAVQARHPELAAGEWSLTPLYGASDEPSGADALVFLVRAADGRSLWGAALSGESGPEVSELRELLPGQSALKVGLPPDGAERLLVVAAPSSDLSFEYAGGGSWGPMTVREDGIAVTPREGDLVTDRFRLLDADGRVVTEGRAQPQVELGDLAVRAEGEGPGTDTPLDVDAAPYALRLSDPWDYRGPAEPSLHPGIAVEATRLFEQGSDGRGWSERGLLLLEREDEGRTVLVQLRTRGDDAVITTTAQRQDEAAAQSSQVVTDGALLVQTFVPSLEGGLLVALAAPRTGAVETDVRGAEPLVAEQGYAVWRLPATTSPGQVLLYSEGDGLLFHAEPARRS